MSLIKKIFDKAGIKRFYPINVNEKVVQIPIHKGLGYANLRNAEPWMLELLRKLGGEEKILLDAGMNVGQTLIAWKTLFPQATYIGFEPNKLCVNYVNGLISKNSFSHCNVEPYGISTETGTTELFMLPKDKGDSTASIIKEFRPDDGRISFKISTTKLSDFDYTNFDIAKVDVEGAELEVIQSVLEVRNDAVFICEILPVYSTEHKSRLERQEKIEKILKENNYSLFRIIKDMPLQLEELTEIGIHSELELCDYIFVPQTKKQEVLSKFK